MRTSRSCELALGVVALSLGVMVAVPVGSSAAASTGYTAIRSSYQVSAGEPTFSGCVVMRTSTRLTLQIRAHRPTRHTVSQAISFGPSTRVGNRAFSQTWTVADTSIVRFTMARTGYLAISYQTKEAGYGFRMTAHPPTNLLSCP